MSDEQYTPEIGSWLKRREVPPRDSEDAARQVAAHLPHVRQRRRRWSFPVLHRGHTNPSTTQGPDQHRDPVPAPSGPSPTAIRKTQTMFSPVKAITAGAVGFAIGGVLLVAQPFDQQGSSVPGVTTPRLVTPVEVSGTGEGTGCSGDDPYEDGNVGGYRNLDCTVDVRMSDERISGIGQRRLNEDWYTDESGGDLGVSTGARALIIENDGGAWRQRPTFWFETEWTAEPTTEVIVLDGEGDYDGLVALLQVTMREGRPHAYRGFIVDGELPPVPDPTSTE